MRNKLAVTLVSFMLLLVLASPTSAFFGSDVKKAKEFMQAGMYPQAIELLKKRISEKPTDAEAHFQLGICYINQGQYSGADERFGSAVRLKSDYGYKIGTEYKKGADSAFSKGNLRQADSLFEKAINYDPKFKAHGYNFYLSLGDRDSGLSAKTFLDKALNYAKGTKQKEKVGYRILRVAAHEWPHTWCDSLKSQAAGIVGQDKVDQVFPKPYMKTIFEQTYTDKDMDEHGRIRTFPWTEDINPRDKLEIIGKIPGESTFDAQEILIWRGKEFKPKWHKSENGYFDFTVQNVPKTGRCVIWMEKGKGIQATVKVSRHTIPKPNIALIESLEK